MFYLEWKIKIIAVSRPPSSPFDACIDEFVHFIKTFSFIVSPFLIAGDFNIHMDDRKDRRLLKYVLCWRRLL